jgi:hypothetical protein
MTGAGGHGRPAGGTAPLETAWALVWIDARAARIVRWQDGLRETVLLSDVPVHRRSTGHVRHDPSIRHGGGGGVPQTADEPHRLEHVRRFVESVAAVVPPDEHVEILGPGTMRQRLATFLREADTRHGRVRTVRTAAAQRMTDPELGARARELAGEPARRQRPPAAGGGTA